MHYQVFTVHVSDQVDFTKDQTVGQNQAAKAIFYHMQNATQHHIYKVATGGMI